MSWVSNVYKVYDVTDHSSYRRGQVGDSCTASPDKYEKIDVLGISLTTVKRRTLLCPDDLVFSIDFGLVGSGHQEVRVSQIDENGVVLTNNGAAFAVEPSTTLRIKYGDKFVIPLFSTAILVEKGPRDGEVFVQVVSGAGGKKAA